MTSETKPLTGLELRKACLIAAGWSIRVSPKGGVWQLVDPDGHILFELTRNADESEDYAWEKLAPAVELSVDAALEYLPMGSTFAWELWPKTDGIQVARIYESISDCPRLVSLAMADITASAMCRAWFECEIRQAWKGVHNNEKGLK